MSMSFASVLRAECLLRAVILSNFKTHYKKNKGNVVAVWAALVNEAYKLEMNSVSENVV